MKIKIKRRTFVKTISFLTAIVAAISIIALQKNIESKEYQTRIENSYSRSLEELSSSINNIDVALEKCIYTGTAEQLGEISAEILSEAGIAKSALSQLPSQGKEISVINKFLSQAGNFSIYLSKKLITNDEITDVERETLKKLSQTASNISDGIEHIKTIYQEEGSFENEFLDQIETNEDTLVFADSLGELEETLTDYPTLIYDGPFSDNIMTEESKMLMGEQEISKDKAKNIAAKAIGISADKISNDSDEEGKMPSYGFKTDDTVISVTKKGGHLVYFRKYKKWKSTKLSYEQAIKKAEEYLLNQGKDTFELTYYFTDEGVCTMNFSHREGSSLCYSDLIKIGVCMETGEVVLYEARGYLMNHYDRTIPSPKYTKEQAQSVLSKALKVESVQQVVILSPANKEMYCYEFRCLGENNEEILVYVNYMTLQEEQIFILLKTDGGILVK